ncbi:MAG: HlyD family efflux transporter periplasmic adaptor subunit [Gammaproteobacteria bacterium]|nr:HlyD family efflux transporter periplasmic adaptor subunit [Gammaproteobacteria bacterium]NIR83338.1 HlyD family efflux transporter periplasmic adaptor subunit [Gammaproteobacteria bacterium]NIR91138.1 HlyD family efflux transporter periplasmic adaptor subunit [Gammaproteobacteria bacterium]NIU04505.1 HlyD family efflux transporter periplasmic adaptor subunit [Gammaproteobacteria bacterium]NIW87141.1 HlyD family efflux transporter periplasmic adaptor subunit [Gammaproteobacteria bacterium]
MRPLFRPLLPLLILALGAGGFVVLKASRPEPQPVASQEKAWIVRVQTATPATRTPELLLYGEVDSPRVAQLTAAISADVGAVPALEGQRVKAGEQLVALDAEESALLVRQREAEVAEIQAQIATEQIRHENDQRSLQHEVRLVELARKAVARARDLAGRNVGSQAQVDAALEEMEQRALVVQARRLSIREHAHRLARLEAQLTRARALRDRARLDAQRARITAPFDGRVAVVFVSPGDRVQTGDRVLDVYDDTALEIRAEIPRRYLPIVRASLERGRTLAARGRVDEQSFTAVLDRLTSRVEPGSGGVDALLRLREGAQWLQLGRTVELLMSLPPEPEVVALPLEAIYGRHRIYKLSGERLASVTVERVGELRTESGETRILVRSSELAPGDRIVVTQLPNAMDGLRVRVASDSTSPDGT